jgi:ABC-2 type transport system ATP-binding protein
MSTVVLSVESIEKEFGRLRAVDKLSFELTRGEIFAMLGPNGAGKTTTIRMLLGIIKPDAGSIRFSLGEGLAEQKLLARTGYLPEDRGLYRDISILRTLIYMGVLRGLDRKDAAKRARKWLDRVELADRCDDKLETLSKGNQQKVQFISAVLHRPEFAVLDEPFAGLDPLNQDLFIEIIRELRRDGATILLSAHQMPLVERLADRVLLMNRGREVESGTVEEIRQRSDSSYKVLIRVAERTDVSRLNDSSFVHRVESPAPGEYVFFIKHGELSQKFLLEVASTVELQEIHTEKVSLHEIFVQAVRGDTISTPGGGVS